MIDKKQRAIELGCKAYAELQEAGISEEFVPIICSIASAQRGTFFGSFGSKTGCFIEFQSYDDDLTPICLRFGIRRYRQSFWERLSDAFREGWRIFRTHDSEHEICLQMDEIAKLKDLLRVI